MYCIDSAVVPVVWWENSTAYLLRSAGTTWRGCEGEVVRTEQAASAPTSALLILRNGETAGTRLCPA